MKNPGSGKGEHVRIFLVVGREKSQNVRFSVKQSTCSNRMIVRLTLLIHQKTRINQICALKSLLSESTACLQQTPAQPFIF